MYQVGRVAGYEIRGDTTEVKLVFPEKLPLKGHMTAAGVEFEDGRHITPIQRKKIYATLRDISSYTGYTPEEAKEWMKYLHIARTGVQYFSLSTCSVETAGSFINTLIDYCLENGVQLMDSLTERTEDISHKIAFY